MNSLIKHKILEIIPSDELRKALYNNDYEYALSIVHDIYYDYNPFVDEFSCFDMLNEGIENKDIEVLENLFDFCAKLFNLEIIYKLIKGYTDDSIDFTNILCLRSSFDTSLFINKLINYDFKDIGIRKSMEDVLNLNIDAVDKDIIMTNYIEGLIHGNELTYNNIMDAYINDDLDTLLDKFYLIKYLRICYLKYQKDNILNLKRSIKLIEMIGLDNK